jgi:hypothetical protein
MSCCTSSGANARLIAAAPELYTTGKALAEAVAHYRLAHDTMGGGHIDTGRAWDKMRKAEREHEAALAKARGEA